MKTSKTILSIAVGAILASSATGAMAQAQNNNIKLEGTTAIVPNAGNALERELTPALREQGRKKVILENKKLDLEIEKLDLDILKVQQEALGVTNPLAATYGQMMGFGQMMGSGSNKAVPALPPNVIDATSLSNNNVDPTSVNLQGLMGSGMKEKPKIEEKVEVNLSGESKDKSDASIRVLMTIGEVGDLKAKIMHNRQGGYVLGKGDILPNGKKIINVTPQYIEVSPPNSKKKADRSKIYVTGYPTVAEEKEWAEKSNQKSVGEDSTTNIMDMSKPIDSPFGLPLGAVPMTVNALPPISALPSPGQVR